MSFITDIKFALRSLARVKGLTITVVATLALGIGANAAIFSVVRGVLLRPLVNKDEDRLIYISQSARGINTESAKFSVPEIRDLRGRVKTFSAVGEFSTIDFTLVGLGEPRVVRAGVVSGSYFEVMGLRPVLGRLLDATRRWPAGRGRGGADPSLLDHRARRRSGRDRQGHQVERSFGDHHRRGRTIGSLPGPDRDHREHRHQPASPVGDDGRGPRAPHDGPVRASRSGFRPRRGTRRAARRPCGDDQRTPRGLSEEGRLSDRRGPAARSDHLAGADRAAGAARGVGAGVHHRVLERRQPDPRAIGAARRRAGDPRRARCQRGRAQAHAARGKPAAVRRRRRARRGDRLADGGGAGALRRAFLRARARPERRRQHALGRRRTGAGGGGAAGLRAAAAVVRRVRRLRACRTAASESPRAPIAGCGCSR